MLNFGASKPRVKGGPRPLGPPGSMAVITVIPSPNLEIDTRQSLHKNYPF